MFRAGSADPPQPGDLAILHMTTLQSLLRPVVLLLGLAGVFPASAPAQAAAAQEGAAPPAGTAAEARVRPGDRIALKVYLEPEMSDTFVVAENGRVVLPKLGAIKVDEWSAAGVQDSLRTAYTAFLRNPSVEVMVLRRVGVQGEVREPNLYLVDLTTTLRDVIAMAGGLTDIADPRRVVLIRDGQEIRLAGGQNAQFAATDLRSGDQIVVGRRSWLSRNALAVATAVPALVSTIVYAAIVLRDN